MHKESVSLLTAVAFVVYTAAIAAGADAPAPAEKNAQLSILTGGESCTIYVDGDIVGDSPTTVAIEPGKHRVQAVPFRGKSKEKTIDIKEHENLELRFDFPLPKPVKAAMRGNYSRDERADLGRFTTGDVIFGVGIVAIIVTAVIVANSGGSTKSSVSIDNGNTTIEVVGGQPAANGDTIALSVNGTRVNELTLDSTGARFSISLDKGANAITVEALSEGTVPGNSGTMTVRDSFGATSFLRWDLPAGASQTFSVNVP
ncbi:MAG TPA: PEGA domain-containing protein [Planctomycetota bacterium]|nr:PEGA domain-containing protein [Planctomycetota bacterium]